MTHNAQVGEKNNQHNHMIFEQVVDPNICSEMTNCPCISFIMNDLDEVTPAHIAFDLEIITVFSLIKKIGQYNSIQAFSYTLIVFRNSNDK